MIYSRSFSCFDRRIFYLHRMMRTSLPLRALLRPRGRAENTKLHPSMETTGAQDAEMEQGRTLPAHSAPRPCAADN